jgi:multicomponent Na+:H+ antiporter subunit E
MLLTLSLAALLAGFWLVLSGHYTPLLLVLGAGSVGLVVWLVHRMGIVDHESVPLRPAPRLPRYFWWLAGEILRSSVSVTRQVWSPRRALRPAVGVVPTPGLPELSQVIYANSITLTPGTLSLRVDDDGIEVHSLDPAGLRELRAGGMRDRVRKLEAG